MGPVRRKVSSSLRVGMCALSAWLLGLSMVAAQEPPLGPGPGLGTIPLPSPNAPPPVATERVLEINIVGNRTITREKVLGTIGTRIGQPFDQATFDKDVRKLVGRNWFVNVEPRRQSVSAGVIITLTVVERPTLAYVKYLGNKKMKATKLASTTGLKKGDSLDPFAVEDGARKIETLYQTKGFNDVKVQVLEGGKVGDRGAVYLINEGQTQKIWKVKFEGNTIASDGRLKTQIQSKPPLLYLVKGHVDRKKIDDDVERLTDYYRGLGYFKARVGRDYEWNEKESWMTLTFHVNEGPRCKVRSVAFLGNQIYDEKALLGDQKLKTGEFYDRTAMNTDIGYFKDLYGSNGYVFADAKADLRINLEGDEVDMLYQISEGQQCVVGDINVHIGGDNPHTRLVTAINRIGLRPGDVIDIRKLRSSERRIKASGLFNTDPSKGDVPKIVLSPPDSEEALAAKKKKGIARQTGNPDTFRGQSPDSAGRPNNVPPAPTVRGYAPAVAPPYPAPGTIRTGFGRPAAAPTTPPAALPAQPSRPRSTGETERFITGAPINGSGNSANPAVRYQSPDGGYGGSTVKGMSPGPQPMSVAQQPGGYAPQPGGYTTQPAIVGAPAAGSIYPNNYSPQGGGAGNYVPGGGTSGPSYVPGNPLPNPNVAPEPLLTPPDDRPRIPLDVYLNEAQTGRFMFGAGVNSNAGLIGSIILDEKNFDWRRPPTSWEDFRSGRAWRGGGQMFRIEAAPGTQVSRYMFNFAEPYLFDTRISAGLSGYYFNRFYTNWAEQRAGGRTSLGYQFTPDLSGNVSFRAEDVFLYNPVPNPTTNTLLLDSLRHTQIYSFKAQMAHDTRDNTFLPTEGHFVSLDVAYTMGTFQYPTYTADFRKFFMLRQRPDGSGRHVLSLYNQFGITGPDTPIYERFYAGGFSTLRGFQFRGASPREPGNASGTLIQVGGDFQNLSSVEYMFPVTADDMLRMVAFCDFGTVEQSVTINWNQFRVAPGIGFRISLPALGPAPIALDFAVPVAYAQDDLKQVFSFFVGYSR